MNDEAQKEYQEHYSPDGEYIEYMMENPEMFEDIPDPHCMCNNCREKRTVNVTDL